MKSRRLIGRSPANDYAKTRLQQGKAPSGTEFNNQFALQKS
jgi:hypothetical protein